MNTIIPLVQGSAEWHAHRSKYRNASETAAVVGANPWMTPYQLWMLRTGRQEQHVNSAMRRGTQLEPAARSAYERRTGNVMQPLVLVSGEYSASLDGLTLDGRLMVEIKCPFKGRDSALWRDASKGNVPEHYRWQIQHQLFVSGADQAQLYVFDGEDGLLLTVEPDPDTWETLQAAWDTFMECLRNDVPPELTERDSITRGDAPWLAAADSYLQLKAEAETLSKRLDNAKAELVALTQHPSETGGGVRVTRFWKQGSVNYKKVPVLQDVDLDAYRSSGKMEVRVSATK